jgi:hypothetical protein
MLTYFFSLASICARMAASATSFFLSSKKYVGLERKWDTDTKVEGRKSPKGEKNGRKKKSKKDANKDWEDYILWIQRTQAHTRSVFLFYFFVRVAIKF